MAGTTSIHRPFTVILTVCDAMRTLPMCFRSLEHQTLDFTKHVDVIIADYGSSDENAEMIQEWANRYSGNVTVVPRVASSLAEARNRCLPLIRGSWTTFLSANDFVREDYFFNVQKFLFETPDFDGIAISCNRIIYNEISNQFFNTHPLEYKYKDEQKIVDISEDPQYVQVDVTSCFFDTRKLKDASISFVDRVRPSFDEGHFIYTLLLKEKSYKIAFLKEAVYFQRVCKSPGAPLEPDWGVKEKYQDQIVFGYLDLAKQAIRAFGSVPQFIQYVLVYETGIYIEKFIENIIPYDLSQEETEYMFVLFRMLFESVDAKNVIYSSLCLPWRTRVAILQTLKNILPAGLPFFVHDVARDKKSLLLARYSGSEETCVARTERGEFPPLWESRVHRQFKGQKLCEEHYMWFSLPPGEEISLFANGLEAGCVCRNKVLQPISRDTVIETQYLPESRFPEPIRRIREAAQAQDICEKFANCWIFIDKLYKADENAEHLYRWLANNPDNKRPIFFVLHPKSPDWNRLKDEGFNLLAYKSEEHLMACWHAEWMVASHISGMFTDPLGTRPAFGLPDYKLAFLGHGITKDDISRSLNHAPLEMVVTATQEEYDSLVQGNSKCTAREVVLSGLPRHDRLFAIKKKRRSNNRVILLCPTWRDSLCTPHSTLPPTDVETELFKASDYYKAWNAVTSSDTLNDMAEEFGYRFIFLLHPYASRDADLFACKSRFEKIMYSQIASVQPLLASCSLMVTDYSSIAMETALIGTPLVYYQFAETPPFFSGHHYTPGYFSYKDGGFGPVAEDLDSLVACLKKYMKTDCVREDVYEERANAFFTLRDEKSCQRVYDALLQRS